MSLTCQICEQPLCPVSDDLWVVEGVLVHYGCVEHKHSVLQSEEDTPRVEPAPAPETHEEMMDRAFPPHLRGSISGCCDSMEDGHG
jgi:hypothetical protein